MDPKPQIPLSTRECLILVLVALVVVLMGILLPNLKSIVSLFF